MATPPEKTIKSLDGKWHIDKSISQDPNPALTLQGIGWLTRKAIGLASVTLHTRSTKTSDDPPATNITIQQTVTGGLKGTTEERTLDWQWRAHSDHIFGDVRGRSRYTTLSSILAESTAEGKANLEADAKYIVEEAEGVPKWLEESRDGDVVESYVESEGKGWTAWQVWGFVEVKGERWLGRRFVVRKGEEVVRWWMVYDWVGELDA